ncbi:MAG TPA: histidine phosphatase family protein [Acidimicrobiales bacterium]|nr:histidine phosphatase family protein [Acidimicrobiales bacterium]
MSESESQAGGQEDGRAEAGVLRIFPPEEGATRIVLVRHGEAECNLNHIIGGPKGCTGLTSLGNHQVAALADRLFESGELRKATALYSSVLPRAVETAERLRPVVGPGPTALGPVRQRCDLCELHPGEADGMEWSEMVKAFSVPDWDSDPTVPIAPGGESWTGFVERASGAVRDIVREHPGELVVAAVHAGVIEATMIAFLGVAPEVYRRGWVRIVHASMTEWEWVPSENRFVLLRFNDSCGVPRRAEKGSGAVEEGAGQGVGGGGKPGIFDRLTKGLLGNRP